MDLAIADAEKARGEQPVPFSQALRRALERSGKTYSQVAAAADFDTAYLYRLLQSNSCTPTIDVILRLGIGLGLSDDDAAMLVAAASPGSR
jgi:DNA-binding phage protein